jgi:hypothetical protein
MAKLRINGDSSGYVDLEAPNAASSSTLDLDQVPQKNVANTFTTAQTIQNDNSYWAANIAESSHASVALRVTPTRAGYTKGISLGAIGKNGALSTGIQAYDTSDNSSNTLELNPHGGAVTTPSQPSFNAQRISNQGIQGGTTLIFDQARHNTGNHYNTSTGVFTAPIAGDYLFTFKSLFYAFSATEYLDLYVTVNGTTRNRYEQTGNSGQHTEIDYTEVVRLNANDTFYIIANNRNSGATLYSMYGNENHFSGYLLG